MHSADNAVPAGLRPQLLGRSAAAGAEPGHAAHVQARGDRSRQTSDGRARQQAAVLPARRAAGLPRGGLRGQHGGVAIALWIGSSLERNGLQLHQTPWLWPMAIAYAAGQLIHDNSICWGGYALDLLNLVCLFFKKSYGTITVYLSKTQLRTWLVLYLARRSCSAIPCSAGSSKSKFGLRQGIDLQL